MQGILLVDKPKTWTSFDVVNYVRKIVAQAEGKKPKNCKVGHTGTLDPLATGLLVLLVGKEYTRRAGELIKTDKTYEVTMQLGATSTTGDSEGDITATAPQTADLAGGAATKKTVVPLTVPTKEAVLAALERFTGQIMQVPPAFSAIKVDGQRAYKLAREGKAVTLGARPVTIYENRLAAYDYPLVQFSSRVSSGTYIRSLVEDLGRELGTGAYMSDLRRTQVGRYSLDEAVTVQNLSPDTLTKALRQLD